MHLIEVEHDVKLANSAKIAIHRLNHEVDDFRDGKLVLIIVNAYNKVEGSITSVNYLVKLVFDEMALLRDGKKGRKVSKETKLGLKASHETM